MSKSKFQPVDTNPNLAREEERLLKSWYESGIVDKYLAKNSQAKKRFSFLDGPITANNPMGVHHGWGRTYKDFWQKLHNLKGFKQRFQNGFDCQGLWVEVEVEKELGFRNKKDIEAYGVEKFVDKCKERVNKFAAIQTEQSKRLGYFMDWDNSYFTMSDANNYMIWHFLKVCHDNGWIYKGKESVPWCPRCQTAISQHEMLTEDYKEVTHKAIYLELPLVEHPGEYLVIWTTTPWTIPANIAVAIDAKLDYCLVKDSSGNQFWVAKDRVEAVFEDTGQIVKTVKGKTLVGLKYRAPFDNLPAVARVAKASPDTFHTVIATDPLILPVSTVEGTGLIHTAVSAGVEDFKLGKKYGLPMVPVIADDASYLEDLGFLSGQNAKKHPELILDYLETEDNKPGENWVFHVENYTHRYPACWRCKTELVWKVAEEWYIAMDKPGNVSTDKHTLRQRMQAVAKKIHWLPQFGLDRELDWLSNMHDWLISKKNRYWGLALPIYECPSCGHFEVIGSREELEKRAVAGWDKFAGHTPHKPHIDHVQIKCSSCGQTVSRIPDVGNVWLDAGIVPFSTYLDPKTGKLSYTGDQKYWRQWFPVDFITESFPGQFKNWFYSMIAMSTVLQNSNPFKTVLGYASVLAEDGRPMHKSWGNAIEFSEGAEKIGVDVMRWLYLRQNPVNNLLFGYKTADEVRRRFVLILWNSYRFFVNSAASLNWQPPVELPRLTHPLDQWIVSRFNSLLTNLEKWFADYDTFHSALAIEEFVNELSTWYIRRSRDRVHPNNPNQKDQHTCLAVLYYLFQNFGIVLSPFMPFLSERLYQNLTGETSVHLADWPEAKSKRIKPQLEKNMELVRKIVESLHALRQSQDLKVRQPLPAWSVDAAHHRQLASKPGLTQLISEETNIKTFAPSGQKHSKAWQSHSTGYSTAAGPLKVWMDTALTNELKQEGELRDLIRLVQSQRKALGINLDQSIRLTLPDKFSHFPAKLLADLKSKTITAELVFGPELKLDAIS